MEEVIKLETGAVSTVAGSDVRATPINPDDLHDLFQGAPQGEILDKEDPLAQLRNDPNYAALIRDLEYIAEAARDLFATEGPSDAVWDKIQKKLGTNEAQS